MPQDIEFKKAQQQYQKDMLVQSMQQKSMSLNNTFGDLKSKYYGSSSIDGSNPIKLGFTPIKDNFRDYSIKQSDIYTTLNNGDKVAKYESYIHGVDNADRLGKKQSGVEKWTNGITKFVGKPALNVLDGTVGTVNGLVQGLADGNFSTVYNNDFSKWVDDMHTRMDYQFPNYKTVQERDMNFLQSMGTANFWADDFFGGMSFMLGTIGSEALWAVATGGASIPMSAARLSLKAGAKVIGKEVAEGIGKSFLKNPAKIMKAYNRTVPLSTAGKVFNNTRFLYTSAGYEAGVEARHSLNESVENFVNTYQQNLGRMPTNEEYSSFMNDAVDNSNGVFAANVALGGASKIAQFGSYFGVGTGLSKALLKTFGKTFGLGITRLSDEGKLVYQALKPSTTQKILGTTMSVLKTFIIEGVVEEGGQRVLRETSKKWLDSKHNPFALKKNMSLIDAAKESFEETYTSKEGLKEVGIGMLIGLVGGAGRRGAMNRWSGFGATEFNQEVQRNELMADKLNEAVPKLTEANIRLAERLVATNQFTTFIDSANKNAEEGNLHEASRDYETAQFSKLLLDHKTDMIDESLEDFKRVVNNLPNEQLKELGLQDSQIEDYKSTLISEHSDRINSFKEARDIAEAISPISDVKGTVRQDYTDALTLNVYLGKTSAKRANDLADTLGEIVGDKGIGDAMKLYRNINDRARTRVKRIAKLQAEIETAQIEYEKFKVSFTQQSTETLKSKEPRVEENKKIVSNLDKLNAKEEKLKNQLTQKQLELQELQTSLEGRVFKKDLNFGGQNNLFSDLDSEGFVTDAQLIESHNALKKLDSYIEVLRKSNPSLATQVENLVDEHYKTIRDFRDFNLVYEQMANPKFMRDSNKGVWKLFNKVGTIATQPEETELDSFISTFDSFVDEHKDKLSEDQIYTLKTLHRLAIYNEDMVESLLLNNSINDQPVEQISNEEYDEFINNGSISDSTQSRIVQKLLDGETLSKRESEMYESNKEIIDITLEDQKLNEGDSIDSIIEQNIEEESISTGDLVQDLRNKLQKIIKNKRYLEDFSVEDFSDENIPTQSEFDEFINLFDKSNQGKISAKGNERLNELKEKINQWGSLEGTFFNEDFTLSDILEQISYLESDSSNNVTSQSFTDLNDLLDKEFKNTVENGRNYDIAQTYENVIVQKTDKDGYILTNINLNGLLDEIGVDSVTRGKEVLNKKESGWDIKSYKENDRFVITFGDNSTMTIRIGSRGRLILSEPSRDTLEKNTGIKLLSAKGTPRNFNYALKEIIDVNEEEKLVPISTNFISMDNQAVQDLKKGDILFMEVDLEDSHNKKILNDYKKHKNVKQLQNSLVINLKTNKNKLVGILKGVDSDVVIGKNTNLEKLVNIRDTATKRVMNNLTEGSTIIDVGIRVPVEQSYLGFPNLNITKKGVQNLPFTKESIKKVKDIGYILNGKTYLKNKNSTFESYPFLTNIIKDGDAKYFNKKIPIVVFDFNDKNIGYPLVLNENLIDLSAELSSIVDSNMRDNDKIIEVNKLLTRANIDIKKQGLTFDNYNEAKLQELQSILSNVNEVEDITKWLDSSINMEDILLNNVSINIDITNRPFHSPKFRLNFKDDSVKGLDSEALVEFDNSINMTEELESESDDLLNEEC